MPKKKKMMPVEEVLDVKVYEMPAGKKNSKSSPLSGFSDEYDEEMDEYEEDIAAKAASDLAAAVNTAARKKDRDSNLALYQAIKDIVAIC